MRAAIMRQQRIVVDQLAAPVPDAGQVLVKTLACGICGSDLHMLRHGPRLAAETAADDRIMQGMDFDRDVVMGHEFCAEVVDFGSDCQRGIKAGQKVCSLPAVFGAGVAAHGGLFQRLSWWLWRIHGVAGGLAAARA